MKGSGYIATVLGAAIGAAILIWPAGYLGAIVEMSNDSGYNDFAGLLGAFVGAIIGVVTGAGLGAWVALRWRKHFRAGPTAWAMGVIGPGSVALAFVLHTATDGVLPDATAWVTVPSLYIGAAVATRFAVLKIPQAFRP